MNQKVVCHLHSNENFWEFVVNGKQPKQRTLKQNKQNRSKSTNHEPQTMTFWTGASKHVLSKRSAKMIEGAYHLAEKSGWGVKSIMVSDLPIYRRNATSVTVWIQKRGEFVQRESGTKTEPRNLKMVSNIPFVSYQPEWKDYLKTYSSIFDWNFRKVTLPFTFHPEFPKFLSNGNQQTQQILLLHRFWTLDFDVQ